MLRLPRYRSQRHGGMAAGGKINPDNYLNKPRYRSKGNRDNILPRSRILKQRNHRWDMAKRY